MSDKNQFSRSFAGKGYYIALILCAAAIGITGYLYYRNQNTAEEVVVEQTQEHVLVGTMATEADVPVIATEPRPQAATQPTAATQPPAKKELEVVAPLAGDTLAEYAMEVLSYNQTTRDWRVHNGVDIAAQEGVPVAAAAGGTVEAAYEDDTMGTTVVIRHDGGYTTHYSSLQQSLCIRQGDEVEAGQTIGYVGSTALVETALGSHLHFGVTYQGQAMDPAEFLAKAG